jgi:hypothetical protein
METRLLGGHGSEFTIEMIFSAEVSRPLLMATSTTILILPWKKIVTVYARERFFIIHYIYIYIYIKCKLNSPCHGFAAAFVYDMWVPRSRSRPGRTRYIVCILQPWTVKIVHVGYFFSSLVNRVFNQSH